MILCTCASTSCLYAQEMLYICGKGHAALMYYENEANMDMTRYTEEHLPTCTLTIVLSLFLHLRKEAEDYIELHQLPESSTVHF